ncbi:50S ribosomal protein L15 [Candidatus Poriferisodalis sp.]|uniref:50S ribosomal protein L15 n=1 Tax=Candidatus Poriferisodalis sp. TaxID=3101277 RepID=UPI003B0136A2
MLRLHDLAPPAGARRKRKRVARGVGGKGGKTAGRGTKGSRARGTVPVWYEGGQLPLQVRVPKSKGFTNPFRVEYQPVNLDTLEESGLDEVTPETLQAQGLISRGSASRPAMVKVLGRGQITRAISLKAHAVSASAREAIEAAGGSIEMLPPAFGGPRPPARGNQHTNR